MCGNARPRCCSPRSVSFVGCPSLTQMRLRGCESFPRRWTIFLANPGMGWETFHRTSEQDKPALVDSVYCSLRPLGMAGTRAAAWQD